MARRKGCRMSRFRPRSRTERLALIGQLSLPLDYPRSERDGGTRLYDILLGTNGRQPRHRLAAAGDDDLLALLDPVEQGAERVLRLESADLHCRLHEPAQPA